MAWQPRYLVQKAPHVGGAPIPEDEPCLVIRANDVLAVMMLLDYLREYRKLPHPDERVIDELKLHQNAVAEWQRTHPTKVADR